MAPLHRDLKTGSTDQLGWAKAPGPTRSVGAEGAAVGGAEAAREDAVAGGMRADGAEPEDGAAAAGGAPASSR